MARGVESLSSFYDKVWTGNTYKLLQFVAVVVYLSPGIDKPVVQDTTAKPTLNHP